VFVNYERKVLAMDEKRFWLEKAIDLLIAIVCTILG